MGHLEPTVALETCERALRTLMAYEYRKAYGEGWVSVVADADRIKRWMKSAEVEKATRGKRGVAMIADAGLDQAEFREIVSILKKNWDPVAAALKPQNITLPMLERFAELRNPTAHSRQLLPFEEDLLSGIAGEIRNRVVIHMSGQSPTGEYYPRIESVVDSFGNQPPSFEDAGGWAHVSTNMALNVGDVVTFSCRGTDPQGRPLLWALNLRQTTLEATAHDTAIGEEVGLTWTVGDRDVKDQKSVLITVRTDNTKYHRRGEFDQGASFHYIVLPPKPADDESSRAVTPQG